MNPLSQPPSPPSLKALIERAVARGELAFAPPALPKRRGPVPRPAAEALARQRAQQRAWAARARRAKKGGVK